MAALAAGRDWVSMFAGAAGRASRSLGAAACALSPSKARARMALEGEARVVAGLIVGAASRGDPRVVESTLDDAWASYGSEPFARAMAAPCWSMQTADCGLWLLTPAEACCMLSHGGWLMRLAELVPAKGWRVRTDARRAFGWDQSKEAAARGINVASVGAMERLCANAKLDRWEAAFEAVARLAPAPGRPEAMAWLAIAQGDRRRMLQAWIEALAIGQVAKDPGPSGARQGGRL